MHLMQENGDLKMKSEEDVFGVMETGSAEGSSYYVEWYRSSCCGGKGMLDGKKEKGLTPARKQRTQSE